MLTPPPVTEQDTFVPAFNVEEEHGAAGGSGWLSRTAAEAPREERLAEAPREERPAAGIHRRR